MGFLIFGLHLFLPQAKTRKSTLLANSQLLQFSKHISSFHYILLPFLKLSNVLFLFL